MVIQPQFVLITIWTQGLSHYIVEICFLLSHSMDLLAVPSCISAFTANEYWCNYHEFFMALIQPSQRFGTKIRSASGEIGRHAGQSLEKPGELRLLKLARSAFPSFQKHWISFWTEHFGTTWLVQRFWQRRLSCLERKSQSKASWKESFTWNICFCI